MIRFSFHNQLISARENEQLLTDRSSGEQFHEARDNTKVVRKESESFHPEGLPLNKAVRSPRKRTVATQACSTAAISAAARRQTDSEGKVEDAECPGRGWTSFQRSRSISRVHDRQYFYLGRRFAVALRALPSVDAFPNSLGLP